ncbi:hypothetical protein B0H11DRAFT_2353133 [Mycena galericulata]|nr:hypothetical protein B0H11DRAFT_2353133 [Mycena galericulata]
MDSAAPKPKGTHGGKRAGSGRKKKDTTLGNPPQNPGNSQRRNPSHPAQTSSIRATPAPIPPQSAAPFFGPYNTHQATPLGNPFNNSAHTGRPAFWSGIWHGAGPSRENAQPSQPGFDADNVIRSRISPAEFDQLPEQLQFIDENDEYADIASGDKVINDSLVDAILEASGTDPTTEQVDNNSSEAVNDSVLQNQFTKLRAKLSREITKYGQPLCYRRGDFYDRPPHPVFALHRSTGSKDGLDPTKLYTGGKTHDHFNDNPIARRVRSLPVDFFLLTNRFVCNPRREREVECGCGKSYQGMDPHIIAQLPSGSFVQTAFPAYISARGAVSKTMMWLMCNTFATRFGDEPADVPSAS